MFLQDLMRRRSLLPSQLAFRVGVSHSTVRRWLCGEDTPSPRSCQKLAAYAEEPLERVLALSGHLPVLAEKGPAEWPRFREYVKRKYPGELDEDLITLIEDLIERRGKRGGRTL